MRFLGRRALVMAAVVVFAIPLVGCEPDNGPGGSSGPTGTISRAELREKGCC